jgi:hypothetical protein
MICGSFGVGEEKALKAGNENRGELKRETLPPPSDKTTSMYFGNEGSKFHDRNKAAKTSLVSRGVAERSA